MSKQDVNGRQKPGKVRSIRNCRCSIGTAKIQSYKTTDATCARTNKQNSKMQHMVFLQNKHLAIEQWLKHQITSPATNNIIGNNLFPTVQIKNLLHSKITNSTNKLRAHPTHHKVLHHCTYLIFNRFTPLPLCQNDGICMWF